MKTVTRAKEKAEARNEHGCWGEEAACEAKENEGDGSVSPLVNVNVRVDACGVSVYVGEREKERGKEGGRERNAQGAERNGWESGSQEIRRKDAHKKRQKEKEM